MQKLLNVELGKDFLKMAIKAIIKATEESADKLHHMTT